MPNQQERIKNRTLRNIPGDQITWRHMESSNNLSRYDREGVRYFAIKLSDEFAEELETEGWPVTWRDLNRNDPNADEPDMQAYLKVFIKYGTRFPCDIYLVNANRKTKTLLDESDLDTLHIDAKDIETIDLLIRPYYWTYGDQHGIKAQVQAMNILLSQSDLDDGYEIVYKD